MSTLTPAAISWLSINSDRIPSSADRARSTTRLTPKRRFGRQARAWCSAYLQGEAGSALSGFSYGATPGMVTSLVRLLLSKSGPPYR